MEQVLEEKELRFDKYMFHVIIKRTHINKSFEEQNTINAPQCFK